MLHHKIFSAAKADAVLSITEFTESRMFAAMNNETPGLLQYTYTREMDISVTELSNYICQTQQNKGLPSKADFTIFHFGEI